MDGETVDGRNPRGSLLRAPRRRVCRPALGLQGVGRTLPGTAHKPRGAEAPACGCICARLAGAAAATAAAGAATQVRALRGQPHTSVHKHPARLLPGPRHLGLGLPAAALLPLTFRPPLASRDAIPDPLTRERPLQPMGVPRTGAGTNCREAALKQSSIPPRDLLSGRRDRAAVPGLGRAVGHRFIRSLGTGSRGQRLFSYRRACLYSKRLGHKLYAKFLLLGKVLAGQSLLALSRRPRLHLHTLAFGRAD